MKRNWILPPTWLKFFIVTLLVLGLFFRFVNLDRKVYWGDEAATSLRISGYTEREIRQQAFNGEIRSIEALQKYQRLNAEKDLTDTIKGLVLEEPQLPPLYYVMVRTWVQWFGDSVAATRSFSALISLLVFPCLYWLCLELFKSPLVAWVAIALVAISPFHVLYAQEARLYSLWTLTILLSSAALLRAIRLKNRLSWFFYAATLSLGFYTTPLTALVAIGHGIYVIGTQGIRTSKLVAYLLASFIGVLTYIPWIFVVASNLAASSSTTEWASRKIPAFQTLASFLINIIIVYLDIPSNFLWKAPPNTYQVTDILLGFLSIPILFLIGYSIYFLYRQTPKEVWLFILTLIAVTSLTFLLPDLLFGGIRSVMPRFQIPVLLGIELAIAYLLATKISVTPIQQQKLWQIAMLALISSGVISCTISSQSDLWWNKYFNTDNLPISRIVNQSKSPLLITDAGSTSSFLTILSISHVLEPKVKTQLLPPVKSSTNIPKIANNFSDVFLLSPSKELREGIEKQQNFQVKSVYDGSKLNPVKSDIFLWKIVNVATF